ncbi:MAG: hypothetical protein Q9187_007034, partial [Circinaria calcarea]
MPAKGLHGGGYSEITAANLANVVTPISFKVGLTRRKGWPRSNCLLRKTIWPTTDLERPANKPAHHASVRCEDCNRVKSTEQYSKKQLSDLRYKIMMFGKNLSTASNKGAIKCRACTGQQTMEMTCIICDTTKGLEGFTKAQRRDPDKADDITLDSGSRDKIVKPSSSSPLQKHNEQSRTGFSEDFKFSTSNPGTPQPYNGGEASTSASNPQQWADWASTTGTESEVGPAGTVWVSQNSAKPKVGTTFTGYDPSGVAHSRYRAPSTVASESFDVTISRSGFAKPTVRNS